jgi:hypothetical protein
MPSWEFSNLLAIYALNINRNIAGYKKNNRLQKRFYNAEAFYPNKIEINYKKILTLLGNQEILWHLDPKENQKAECTTYNSKTSNT